MQVQRAVLGLLVLTLAMGPPTACAAEAPRRLALGERAPMAEVKMRNVDERELAIADVRGRKGTLVIFTCNSCPWVKAWERRIAGLGNEWSKKGVGVIAINPNDPRVSSEDGFETMVRRVAERGMRFPYVVDATSDVARAFGATRTPEVFLFDAEGRLVYHGAIDDNAKEPGKVRARYLEDALRAVTAGKPVAVADTKALGCSIKFRGGS